MIHVNLDKAKAIAHNCRRLRREQEFAPHDKVIALQIPGQQAANAEAERQLIRDKYAAIQESIDDAQSTDELKAILDAM